MILYFSGTGNSEYVARRIGKELHDEAVNLFEKIRGRDFSELRAKSPWVIVAPTYAWRIPRILEEWLENTNLVGNRDIYFIMTCGGSIGNAGKYLETLCNAKKLHYLGCLAVPMPENYIALFRTPAREEALETIRRAEGVIDQAALAIHNNEAFAAPARNLQAQISSGIVNQLFYPMFVHAKKFYATDACVSCGKCVQVCPLRNIRLAPQKPVWGENCTHCMACICRCPTEAIEYGNHSKGQPRYICPKAIEE